MIRNMKRSDRRCIKDHTSVNEANDIYQDRSMWYQVVSAHLFVKEALRYVCKGQSQVDNMQLFSCVSSFYRNLLTACIRFIIKEVFFHMHYRCYTL